MTVIAQEWRVHFQCPRTSSGRSEVIKGCLHPCFLFQLSAFEDMSSLGLIAVVVADIPIGCHCWPRPQMSRWKDWGRDQPGCQLSYQGIKPWESDRTFKAYLLCSRQRSYVWNHQCDEGTSRTTHCSRFTECTNRACREQWRVPVTINFKLVLQVSI